MGSGIIFVGHSHYCSNGMIEYLLDLAIDVFPKIDGQQNHSHILEYFKTQRKCLFTGMYIFIDQDDLKSPSDGGFLARLFEKVFAIAQSGTELTDIGKEKLLTDFSSLLKEFRSYSQGTLEIKK